MEDLLRARLDMQGRMVEVKIDHRSRHAMELEMNCRHHGGFHIMRVKKAMSMTREENGYSTLLIRTVWRGNMKRDASITELAAAMIKQQSSLTVE